MPKGLTSPRWRWLVLLLALVPALLARLWIIGHLPDPDSDASGHLGIARALLADPTNIAIHWVYLPAYHYWLAMLEAAGLSARAIRYLNAGLATLVPIFVLLYGESLPRSTREASRHVPLMAALFCAVCPLVNLLGTSAQQETAFVLLVLGTVWSIDSSRFLLAGFLLAVAALVRYEAWGAVALIVGLHAVARVPGAAARASRIAAWAERVPFIVVAPSLVAIGGWLLAHKLSDGQWLGFLRELYRYTHLQRDSIHRAREVDLLWFPIRQPLFVFGWVVIGLFVVGLRRVWRPSFLVPLGIYLFLQAAYLSKGALGSARYYESLMPFIALGAAEGACVLGSRCTRAGARQWLVVTSLFVVAFCRLVMLSAQMYCWTWPAHRLVEARSSPRSAARHAGS